MSAPDLFTAPSVTRATLRSSTAIGTRGKRIAFNVHEGEDVRTINPAGRDAWALGHLIVAGGAGCTPIEQVGPRWSHYIFKLRRTYGLNVETIDEAHGGEFSGSHARYVLRSRVAFADPADAARMEARHA
jgi:hypothetical protein